MPNHAPWTFAMATPDAIVGGYLDLILERAREHGFVARASRVLGLDYERLGRMYSHRDQPPGYSGQRIELPPWLMTPLYQIAPAVVLVLTRSEGDACSAMLRCKGATRPEKAAAGTVRAAGENYVFNLMHCPDDAPSAAIELAYLVGPTDAAGLQSLAAGDDSLEPLVGLPPLRRCLPAFSGWEALSFPVVAVRIRSRIAQKLGALALQQPMLREPLLHAADALQREHERLVLTSSAAERMTIAQAVDASVHVPLLTAARLAGDETLVSALSALSALHDLDGPREATAIRALERSGVYLSELEKLVIDTQAYTFWRED